MEFSFPQGQMHLALPADLQLRRQAAQAVRQRDPLSQPRRVLRRGRALRAGVVHLVHMVFRRQQPVGQRPVVGQQ